MLPGIQPETLPQLPAGAVCSLFVPGNPAPLAVSSLAGLPGWQTNPARFGFKH